MTDHQIRILLFARYAELVGRGQIDADGSALNTVADAVALVRSLPGGSAIPERPLVAVNATQAALGSPIAAGDEVALLPPLAGG